jgi:hypothetical protein
LLALHQESWQQEKEIHTIAQISHSCLCFQLIPLMKYDVNRFPFRRVSHPGREHNAESQIIRRWEIIQILTIPPFWTKYSPFSILYESLRLRLVLNQLLDFLRIALNCRFLLESMVDHSLDCARRSDGESSHNLIDEIITFKWCSDCRDLDSEMRMKHLDGSQNPWT